MTKLIFSTLTLAAFVFNMVMANSALASRARLLVLGDGTGGVVLNNYGGGGNSGSLIYNDKYSIFYNPVLLNPQLEWAVVEKSNGVDSAQGGFSTTILNFKTAVYLNRPLAGNYGASLAPVDFVLSADMGIQWGLGLTYARADDDTKHLGIRLGFSYYGFEPFFNMTLQGSSLVGKNENLLGGLRYRLGEWTPFVAYRKDKVGNGLANTVEVFAVGMGRHFDVTEGVKMNWGLSYASRTVNQGVNQHLFPFEISVEAEAASWLTLRGGFAYKKSGSSARMGAGIHVGKATLDWALGGSGANTSTESIETLQFGFDSNFFTAASLSYEW